jgi:hypothetical protein
VAPALRARRERYLPHIRVRRAHCPARPGRRCPGGRPCLVPACIWLGHEVTPAHLRHSDRYRVFASGIRLGRRQPCDQGRPCRNAGALVLGLLWPTWSSGVHPIAWRADSLVIRVRRHDQMSRRAGIRGANCGSQHPQILHYRSRPS